MNSKINLHIDKFEKRRNITLANEADNPPIKGKTINCQKGALIVVPLW